MSEFQDFLIQISIPSHIAANFFGNEVSGQVFLKLTEDDIKELVPVIGIRPKVRDIIEECRKVSKNM